MNCYVFFQLFLLLGEDLLFVQIICRQFKKISCQCFKYLLQNLSLSASDSHGVSLTFCFAKMGKKNADAHCENLNSFPSELAPEIWFFLHKAKKFPRTWWMISLCAGRIRFKAWIKWLKVFFFFLQCGCLKLQRRTDRKGWCAFVLGANGKCSTWRACSEAAGQ